MTHGDDHDMPDFDMSMLQINVDDDEVDDSQGVDMSVDMESEEEDDDDNEMPEYVEWSDIYDDVNDNGEGDEDLDGSFIVVRGASKWDSRPPTWRKDYV